MAVNGINYANPYAGYVNFNGSKNNTTSVSKPINFGSVGHSCIYNPEKEEANKKSSRILTALGLAAAAALAFVFRGKIKGAVETLKPYIQKGVEAVKPYVTKAVEKGKAVIGTVTKAVEPYLAKAKTVATNALNAVKGFFTKAKV
jgi:hypothetical protein